MGSREATAFDIPFRGKGARCRVRIGRDVVSVLAELWSPSWREAALVGDATVLGLWGETVAKELRPLVSRWVQCDFPPGEAHKTRATKAAIEDQLLAAALSRQTCIVALGGGISLDLAGFVAATYLRGVPYLSLPTSLLAQVDAAIGGKTGVNTDEGKNLIGAFHQPTAVVVDTRFLTTLSLAEWQNGLAEVIKHGVIADPDLFSWVAQHHRSMSRPRALPRYPILRSLRLKARVVRRDEREGGLRSVLNFGHTIGHALERATDHRLRHGEAVAVGMLVEARVARELTGFSEDDVQRLHQLVVDSGLPSTVDLPFARLVPFLQQDKKREEGGCRLALPRRIGEMARTAGKYTWPVALDCLARAWDEVRTEVGR